jgi:hypothetical protein
MKAKKVDNNYENNNNNNNIDNNINYDNNNSNNNSNIIENETIYVTINNYDNNIENNIENNNKSNQIIVNNEDTDLSFDFSTKTTEKVLKTISNNEIEKSNKKNFDYFEIDLHSNKENFSVKNEFEFKDKFKLNIFLNCIQMYLKNLFLFIENFQTLQKIFILTSFIEAHNHAQRKIPYFLGFSKLLFYFFRY